MDSIDKSMWAPTVDGVELTDTPVALLERGQVAQVPMLFGTNRDEGSTFTGNQTGNGVPPCGAVSDSTLLRTAPHATSWLAWCWPRLGCPARPCRLANGCPGT